LCFVIKFNPKLKEMFALFALLALAEAKDGFRSSSLRRLKSSNQPKATEAPKSELDNVKDNVEKIGDALEKGKEVMDKVNEGLDKAEGWLNDFAGDTVIGKHCNKEYTDDGMVERFEWFSCMLCAVFDGLSGTIKISILSGLIVYLIVSTITLVLKCFCCCV